MLKLTILDRAAEVQAPPVVDGPGVYIWRDLAGRPCAYGHSVSGQHWMQWPHLASYRFDDDGSEVVAYPAPSAPRDVIVETFHHMVLPLALQRRGLEALHASGVVMHGRVVAFCAVSGTGKSTLAYALRRTKGYTQWSDDAVVFEVTPRTVAALALPFDVRLLPETAAELARLQTAGPAQPVRRNGERVPLGAICVLVRRGLHEPAGEPRVTRLSGSRALARILEHAHCFSLTDPIRKKRMLEHYLDLVDRVCVYEVRFSSGLERVVSVADAISRALDR